MTRSLKARHARRWNGGKARRDKATAHPAYRSGKRRIGCRP